VVIVAVRGEEDRLEVPEFPRDLGHLGAVEPGGVREHSEAVAPVGPRREDVYMVVAHGRDTTQR